MHRSRMRCSCCGPWRASSPRVRPSLVAGAKNRRPPRRTPRRTPPRSAAPDCLTCILGELGKARLASNDIARWNHEPLDVVVDQFQHGVQVLAVQQIEVPPHDGQVVVDPDLTQLRNVLAGFSRHGSHLSHRLLLRTLASIAAEGIPAHPGQRQSTIGAGTTAGLPPPGSRNRCWSRRRRSPRFTSPPTRTRIPPGERHRRTRAAAPTSHPPDGPGTAVAQGYPASGNAHRQLTLRRLGGVRAVPDRRRQRAVPDGRPRPAGAGGHRRCRGSVDRCPGAAPGRGAAAGRHAGRAVVPS